MSSPSFTGECLIGGRWLMGGGASFVSISPSDGSESWKGNEASHEDVNAAVAAANASLPAWRRCSITERIGIVRAFAKLVDARRSDMAAIISRATGKPLWDAATEAAAPKLEERLHKVLAQAGLGSRRALEHFQDLQARQGGLQPAAFQFFGMRH